jgi:SH3-like domain-containing protein
MAPWRTVRPGFLVAVLTVTSASSVLPACSREGRPGRLNLPAEGVPEPPADPASRHVLALSALRREPTEQARVKPSDGSRAPVANAITVLHRGERVTLVEGRGDWSRVRASDGEEGWLKSASLLPSAEVQEGTVLAVAWAFDRPDLLAANARRKLEPGTLLFIRKTKDLFTEVDAGPGGSTWILTDRVTTAPGDVAAAKLVEKARFLRRNDRTDEARELLALLRSRSPDSPLVPVLAAELGETPPDGGPPEGATGPSGPGAPTGPAAPDGAPPRSP